MTYEEAKEVLDLAESFSRPLTLEEAAKELGYDRLRTRGVARKISCAWQYFEDNGDTRSAAIIARSFVNKNGEFPWS